MEFVEMQAEEKSVTVEPLLMALDEELSPPCSPAGRRGLRVDTGVARGIDRAVRSPLWKARSPVRITKRADDAESKKVYGFQKRDAMLAGFADMWTKGLFCDCIIIAKDGTTEGSRPVAMKAHKVVVSAASSTLKAELIEKSEIVVDDVSIDTIKKILAFVYSGSIELSDECVMDIYLTACRFEILDLKTVCEEHFSSHINLDSVLGLLEDAFEHNAPVLKEKCFQYITSNGASLFERKLEQLLTLSKQCVQAVLEQEFTIDEHVVFDFVLAWGNRRLEEHRALSKDSTRQVEVPSLLAILRGLVECVRFTALRKKYLREIVIPSCAVPSEIIVQVLFERAADPAYLKAEDAPPSLGISAPASGSSEKPIWLRPRGRLWKTMSDFGGHEGRYAEYMKSVLKPGMLLRAVRGYENVSVGDVGEFVQYNSGIPPCQVRWRQYGGTYWLYWRDLEIVQ